MPMDMVISRIWTVTLFKVTDLHSQIPATAERGSPPKKRNFQITNTYIIRM